MAMSLLALKDWPIEKHSVSQIQQLGLH